MPLSPWIAVSAKKLDTATSPPQSLSRERRKTVANDVMVSSSIKIVATVRYGTQVYSGCMGSLQSGTAVCVNVAKNLTPIDVQIAHAYLNHLSKMAGSCPVVNVAGTTVAVRAGADLGLLQWWGCTVDLLLFATAKA